MKKLLITGLIAAMLVGCGSPKSFKVREVTKEYPTYGLFNQEYQSNDVCYTASIGNVVWSIILIETVVAPVYFVGFSLFNPVRLKISSTDTCKNV